MVIAVVYEGLEVANLDLLLAALTLEERVQLEHTESLGGVALSGLLVQEGGMALKKLLDDLVRLQLVVSDS